MTVPSRQAGGFAERRTNLDIYERGASALAGLTLTYLWDSGAARPSASAWTRSGRIFPSRTR